MAKDTSLTKPQLAAYWRAATAAARNVGEPLDAYRKRVMREECGVASVKALNRTGDFDKVMCRFAVDAGDYCGAERFATAGAGRLSAMIGICCAQIMQLKGEPAGSSAAADYLAGVVRQAQLPCGTSDAGQWIDCPEDGLLSLFRMLDTHRRRLLRQLADQSSIRRFMAFDHRVVYEPLSSGVRLRYDVAAYADRLPLKVNLK